MITGSLRIIGNAKRIDRASSQHSRLGDGVGLGSSRRDEPTLRMLSKRCRTTADPRDRETVRRPIGSLSNFPPNFFVTHLCCARYAD
jgi:hypothetical protein